MNVMRDKLTAAAAELEMVDEDGNPIAPDPDDPPEGVITETVSLFFIFVLFCLISFHYFRNLLC